MKKLITTLCLTAVAAGAFAQGTVNFFTAANSQNYRTNAVGLGGTAGNMAGTLGGFQFALLTAPSTVLSVDASLQNLLSGPWSDTGVRGTNILNPGHMNGGNGLSAANWPGGAAGQSYIVVGWSSDEGATWASLSSKLAGATLNNGVWTGGGLVGGGFVGASTLGTGISGGGTFPAWAIFGASSVAQGTPISTITDMYIVGAVPEPTTFALLGLGAAGIMIFRRRKA